MALKWPFMCWCAVKKLPVAPPGFCSRGGSEVWVYRGSRVRSPPVPVVLSVYQRDSLLNGLVMHLSCDMKKFHDNESTHTHTHTHTRTHARTHARTHTHTGLTALCPGLPRWAVTRKVKTIWILLKQEIVSGSGISWAMQICTSLQTDNHASTSLLSFYRPFALPATQPTASKHWRQ